LLKYQIGSGMIAGRERIVLSCQETYLDLFTLLNNAHLKEALSLVHGETPASLMHMMRQWLYWREKLPQVVEYAFAYREQDRIEGQLNKGEIRWLPPLMYPHKLICLGANYKAHNAEMGFSGRPKYPYCFLKPATTTLVGSGETVALPELAKMIDWEVELAVVIGQKARNVRGKDAMDCIAGYSILNDISARDWVPAEERSFMGFDWVMLKAFDGFAPMGPFITPAEFVRDPQDLALTLAVNGQIKQHSTTADMEFSVLEILEHLAAIMTLEPGDVIATGTPPGVGFGMKPPQFLRSGDRMVAEIEGLGSLETLMK
jgi:2,4-diketo-3-deoxy-L-fuconate hydrolase